MTVQKYILIIFLMSLYVVLLVAAQYDKDVDSLVWAQEFNYKGHPKTEFWGYEIGYVRNKEAQYYTRRDKKNVRVRKGCLEITALRSEQEPKDNRPCITSGSINTNGKQELVYGRIEVRAKIPTDRGA